MGEGGKYALRVYGVSHVNAEDVVEVDHVLPHVAVSLKCGRVADLDILAVLGEDGDGLSVDELGDFVGVGRSLPPLVVVLLERTVEVSQPLGGELPHAVVAREVRASESEQTWDRRE